MRATPARLGIGLLLAAIGLPQAAALAQANAPAGRWQAEEHCPGQPPRHFILASDGAALTARLARGGQEGPGSILGFGPLLPGGRFVIDIATGGYDAKSSYTGRLHPDGTGSADGGTWSGSAFTPCQVRLERLDDPLEARPGSGAVRAGRPEPAPAVTAGRPEPIPSSAAGSALAGRPEPIPPPRTSPAAPPTANVETEALRRQLAAERARADAASRRAVEAERQAEEDRRRAEAAERAMRLNESLARQGRN